MKSIYLNLILFVFLAILLLLPSCSERHKCLPLLLKIDTIMLSNSDSAYKMLLSIKESELESREEKAFFALLLTQAKDKNNIYIENDSVISYAINYYNNTTNKEMKNKSYFYLGRVLQENKNISEAISAYLKAIDEKSENYKIQALIYDNLATCYENQNFIHKAFEAFENSYLIHKKHCDTIGMFYSLRGIANQYSSQGDASKAKEYYNQALKFTENINDPALKSAIYCDLSRFYHNQVNYKLADKYIDLAMQYDTTKDNLAASLFWKGKILFDWGHYDSCYYYFDKASASKDIYIKTACYQSLYELKKKQHLYNEAISYNDMALILYDSIQNSLRQEEINEIIKEHEIAIIKQKNKTKSHKYIAITLFCVIIGIFSISIFVISFHNHIKKKKLKLQDDLRKIIAERNAIKEQFNHLSLINENKDSENKELQINLIRLWQQTMIISTQLFKTTEAYKKILSIETCKYTPGKQKKKEEIKNIHEEIMNIFAQSIQNLQESFPALTHEDIIYCILCYLKLSTTSLKICMQTESSPALTQRKYRIKKQLSKEVFDIIFG